MSLNKALGYFTGREFHESLFSSPSDQAKDAATTSVGLQNNEIQQEQGYVDKSEGQLRNAIAGLGPNPYFKAGSQMKPTPVNPGNTTNFFSAAPQTAPAAAPPASANFFAAPAQGAPRAAQPVARNPAAQ